MEGTEQAEAHRAALEDRGPLDNRRLLAVLLDLVLTVPIALLVAWYSGGFGALPQSIYAVFTLFYFSAFEACWNGQTPGKRLFGLRVRRADGAEPSMSAIAVRTLGRCIDHSLVGVVVLLFTRKKRQRIGDIAAATIVTDATESAAPRGGSTETSMHPALVAVAARRATVFGARRLIASLVVVLAFLGTVAWGASESVAEARKARVTGVVRHFVEAATTGETRLACGLLTRAYAADLARRASTRGCRGAIRRLYLGPSVQLHSDTYVDAAFLRHTELVTTLTGGALARVDGPDNELLYELAKRDGTWRIDGMAQERHYFIVGCRRSGRTATACACVFDGLRERGDGTGPWMRAVLERARATGAAPAPLAASVRACGVA